jgi:hypothetical protein
MIPVADFTTYSNINPDISKTKLVQSPVDMYLKLNCLVKTAVKVNGTLNGDLDPNCDYYIYKVTDLNYVCSKCKLNYTLTVTVTGTYSVSLCTLDTNFKNK